MQPIRWRAIFVSALTLVSLYCITPTLMYFAQPKEGRLEADEFVKTLPKWLPQSHVKLGLDLVGGVQLVLGVQTESAIESRLGRLSTELIRWASEKDLGVKASYVSKGTQKLTVELENETKLADFKAAFAKEYPHLTLENRKNLDLQFSYKPEEMDRIRKSALEQAERVVRNRVDTWGVTEPQINRRADGSVLVQLPGFRNPQRAKELLGRTAQLKFKIVDDEFTGFDAIDAKTLPAGMSVVEETGGHRTFRGEDREAMTQFLAKHIPENRELLFDRTTIGDGTQGRYRWTSYVLKATTELTGDDVADASLQQGQTLDRRPVVAIRFTGSGGKIFAQLTGANVKKRLAIVLDDVVESAATISEKISGGAATITLGSSLSQNEQIEQGKQLAMVLKSGAVPAAIAVLSQSQVGATLGPELASQGIKGIMAGLLFVLLFMIIYYRRPGVIACLALLLNAVYLLALMAGFGFALTLPGIAGFVLTLGMAVDANVLINERIRQEIREGRHPRKAVEFGFNKAFATIIDSHVTTLIAGVVLLETTGSGPIRGFAVPLIIGLLVSLFTSLNCAKLFFDIAMRRIPDQELKKWLGGDTIAKPRESYHNFLKSGPIATVVFIFLSVAVVATGLIRGVNFGVDFVGGTEMKLGFAEGVEAQDIRNVAEKSHIADVTIQSLEGGSKTFLVRYDEGSHHTDIGNEQTKASGSEVFQNFRNHLLEDLKEKKPEILQVDFVGPQVGKELRTAGLLSVLLAIIAVAGYIAFRFDMRFSPGALIKMFLDVFIMLGFYVFFGYTFDLVSIAAFLTVVGYSVNDTIVIYDRIRESMIQNPRRELTENINTSINETLSRSINTSLTVILSLLGILIFASGQLWSFAMAMTIGVVVATLSSIFVASTFVIWFENWRNKRGMTPAKATKA